MLLNRENISNAAVMIQPSLISYSFNSLPQPALLDVASIAMDKILLLDSYFSLVIFHGMTIAQWRNMGYHNQPEYQVFLCFPLCHLITGIQFVSVASSSESLGLVVPKWASGSGTCSLINTKEVVQLLADTF